MISRSLVSAADRVRDLPLLSRQLADAADGRSLRPLGLGGVLLGSGVLASLVDILAELRAGDGDVALLADCRPMAGATPDVKAGIEEQLWAAGIPVRRITVGDGDARVHADAATIELVVSAASGAAVLVSVGSGTVTDVGKAVSARTRGMPHVAVQTAASVNGFADDQSVLLKDGVKRTIATRWPDRLVIDTDVLSLAPAHLNCAGLGDLIASYTAPADWFLASVVGQDASYSPAVVALTRAHADSALEAAAGIGAGDAAAIENLAAALALSGIAMGVAGRTSPGSGMEHTVSHLLEMAEPPDREAPLHGAKVGVLSILEALLWVRVRDAARAGRLASLAFPSPQEMRSRVHEAFGRLDPSGRVTAECWREYERKLVRWHGKRKLLGSLPERWESVDSYVGELLAPPERLVGALRAAHAPIRLGDLGIEPDTARWALQNCHLMRDRFTVADLAFLMGIWEADDVDALLDETAGLGAGL